VFDGLAQRRLIVIAPPRIGTESDVTGGELDNVEHGTVVRLFKDDANLSATFRATVIENDRVEGCAAYAVAVGSDVDDLEFHGRLLSIQVTGLRNAEFGELPFQLVEVVVEGGIAGTIEFLDGGRNAEQFRSDVLVMLHGWYPFQNVGGLAPARLLSVTLSFPKRRGG
jgi:hypothetical protein